MNPLSARENINFNPSAITQFSATLAIFYQFLAHSFILTTALCWLRTREIKNRLKLCVY